MADVIRALRRFNRSWSRRVGVLEDSFLGSGRALGPNRLLLEVDPDGTRVGDLRERLGLDSGYVSRLLRQLEDEGLVQLEPDPADARRRLVLLTVAGRRARSDLEDRSDRRAHDVVDPLSPRLRDELGVLLDRADRIVRSAGVTISADDPTSPDAKHAASAYLRELDERFSTGFDPEQAAHDAEDFAGDRGRFFVVRSEDEVIGCGALRWLPDGSAEIKRMWVDPGWRGLGIAARLLRRLEEAAAEHGHAVVRLDTNAELTAAVAMYRSAGYTEVPRYNDNPYAQHWFEKRLDPPAGVRSSS